MKYIQTNAREYEFPILCMPLNISVIKNIADLFFHIFYDGLDYKGNESKKVNHDLVLSGVTPDKKDMTSARNITKLSVEIC